MSAHTPANVQSIAVPPNEYSLTNKGYKPDDLVCRKSKDSSVVNVDII